MSKGSSAARDMWQPREGMCSVPLRIGVSSCLLGEPVRYNGAHARDLYVRESLGRYFEYVPVCPEVEIGLGVPRPTLRLQYNERNDLRLICPATQEDHTERMTSWAQKRLRELADLNLCGFILKKNSPSCGLRVRTFRADGKPAPWAPGRFAAVLRETFPLLPIIEEGRLHDPQLRENWVERVFAYHRLKQLWAGSWNLSKLIEFHTVHKLQLMVHSPKKAQEMGRWLARAKGLGRAEIRKEYEQMFMSTLAIPATRGRHVNVMHHMLGYFRDHLDKASREELLRTIEEYRRGIVPLIVPLVLIRHYVRIFNVEYLQKQLYLEPYPPELALRSQLI